MKNNRHGIRTIACWWVSELRGVWWRCACVWQGGSAIQSVSWAVWSPLISARPGLPSRSWAVWSKTTSQNSRWAFLPERPCALSSRQLFRCSAWKWKLPLKNVPRDDAASCGVSKQKLSPEKVYHMLVAPCFDKKLEAVREEFYNSLLETRDVDCVLTSGSAASVLFFCVHF